MRRVGELGVVLGLKVWEYIQERDIHSPANGKKMASFVFPSQLIQLSKAKLNKAANCPAQNHHDITACFQGFSNFSLSSWREAAPHTILIFWGQRAPYPASSYTAIVNILLDRWEVPLTPLTVTVHGDLYRRYQSQCYVQRCPHTKTHTVLPHDPFTHAETVGRWGCLEMWVQKATHITL